MAACEKCGTKGYAPYQMLIDPQAQLVVGPCCATPAAVNGVRLMAKPNVEDVEYGIQISNKVGISAYLNYAGFSLTFDKTPAELRQWAVETGLVQQTTH